MVNVKKKKPLEVPATTYLGFARQYFNAAEIIIGAQSRKGLHDPIYFLYFHTTELLLKAFLRKKGLAIRKGHKITAFYEKCRSLGLVVPTGDRFGMQNIVSLLEKGNEADGFRYFNPNGTSLPALDWTRDVVGELLKTVEQFVEAGEEKRTEPGPVSKIHMIFGKPVPKKS
jgi:hypothetical protein